MTFPVCFYLFTCDYLVSLVDVLIYRFSILFWWCP